MRWYIVVGLPLNFNLFPQHTMLTFHNINKRRLHTNVDIRLESNLLKEEYAADEWSWKESSEIISNMWGFGLDKVSVQEKKNTWLEEKRTIEKEWRYAQGRYKCPTVDVIIRYCKHVLMQIIKNNKSQIYKWNEKEKKNAFLQSGYNIG